MQRARINTQITAPQLRVIGADGQNLGVLSREEALALVRPGEGLDLIEISPTATPPVARLMSFDKYRYEAQKAEKTRRRQEKTGGPKQVQISARAAHNDLLIKLKKLEEFLAEDHPVDIQVRLRGREKGNRPWAFQKLEEFMKMITTEYRVITPARSSGNGILVQITKKK